MNLIQTYKRYIFESLLDDNAENNDFYKLAKPFEWYVCLMLSEKYNCSFYHYNDINPSFKEENGMTQQDTGIDCCNLVDTIVQCKLRKDLLTWRDCATFFASQNIGSENKESKIRWNKLIIARNQDSRLSRNLESQCNRFFDYQYSIDQFYEYYNRIKLNPPTFEVINNQLELREYQKESIEFINTNTNCIICLPTGCGKSVILINSFIKECKYLVLVPRIILMEQLYNEILKFFPFYKDKIQLIGDGNNSFNEDNLITICVYNSIDVVYPYIETFVKVFIDEAHHIYKPDIYLSIISHETYSSKIYDLHLNNNVVAMSATIDKHQSFSYYKQDIRYMIEREYLCDYTIHIPIFSSDPSNKNIAQYLVKKYRYIIIYCNSKREGIEFNTHLNNICKGISRYIDGDTKKRDRQEILKSWKNGDFNFLVNVELLIEGFDAPITRGVCFLHMPTSKIKVIQVIGRALRKHSFKTIANVILPFSMEEDNIYIKEFLQTIAKNDKRIMKSYSTKTVGGYINIYTLVESNETKYRQELIYDSLGNRLHTSYVEEKCKALLEFVKFNNHVPKYKDNLYSHKIEETNEIIQFNICDFYISCKRGLHTTLFTKILEENKLIKEDYEQYLYKKNNKITPEQKMHVLEWFTKENNRVPSTYEKVIYEGIEYNLGKFYSMIKEGHNKKILSKLLETNDIVKKNYELYLHNKDTRIAQDDKLKYLQMFLGYEERLPKAKETYKVNDLIINIGSYYDSLKQKNNETFQKLVNEYALVKQDYEKLVKFREKKIDISFEEKLIALEHFININNRVPKPKETYIYEGIEIKLGIFYDNNKRRKNEDFLKFINTNETAKLDYYKD